MKTVLVSLLAVAVLPWVAVLAEAQAMEAGFKQVNASVVVIRTKEREGQGTSVRGVGSGVLISADEKVMAAAHVVRTADEVLVEFLSGDVVEGRVVASEPEADVSLLQLERVPARAIVAKLGNSDAVEVGDPVFITVGGDVVLRVLGIPLEDLASYREIQARLSRLRSGDAGTLRVLREGRLEELTARVP